MWFETVGVLMVHMYTHVGRAVCRESGCYYGIRIRELWKSGDSEPAHVSSWPYFNTLLFLQETVRHRKLAILV